WIRLPEDLLRPRRFSTFSKGRDHGRGRRGRKRRDLGQSPLNPQHGAGGEAAFGLNSSHRSPRIVQNRLGAKADARYISLPFLRAALHTGAPLRPSPSESGSRNSVPSEPITLSLPDRAPVRNGREHFVPIRTTELV